METRLDLEGIFPGNITLHGSIEKELPRDLVIPVSCMLVAGTLLIIILLIICSGYLEEEKSNDSTVISSVISPKEPVPMIEIHKLRFGISDFCREQKLKVTKSTSMPVMV